MNLPRENVRRISVSLPQRLLENFDDMVVSRGFESRSQAVADMIRNALTEFHGEGGKQIMAGTITLVYDLTRPGLQKRLADLQYRYVDEVISSLHVNLQHAHIMEVILVQGPVMSLQAIADELRTCRGVISGKLQLTTAIMPPVHPLPGEVQVYETESEA